MHMHAPKHKYTNTEGRVTYMTLSETSVESTAVKWFAIQITVSGHGYVTSGSYLQHTKHTVKYAASQVHEVI
jgi:hypothetical protein